MITLEQAVNAYEKAHGATIDYARPQSWFDAVLNATLIIDPRDYLWVYDKGHLNGRPIHKDTVIADVLNRFPVDVEYE